MTDTRALLSRIAEFRKRLEAMPRLTPGGEPAPAASAKPVADVEKSEAGSRTQAILEYSLRQLGGNPEATPPALTNRARRLLTVAQGLVTRMKALADDPLLAGPPLNEESSLLPADPLAVHYRETAALTEAAVRYVFTFPESSAEQARLCEGLEGMIDAARRRFDLMTAALERRRVDEGQIDTLARFLVALDQTAGSIDSAPIENLADELLAEDPSRQIRFRAGDPLMTQAYLGGPSHPAPSRFVAGNGLNCATVLARVIRLDRELRDRAREVVIAGLLHDVGMLRVDPRLLAHREPWGLTQRREMEIHARVGAERIAVGLPGFGDVVEAVAGHHERADGTGYPAGIADDRISAMSKLLAAADVYAAICSPRPHRLPHDPRAALADVMMLAERGKLDRYAAEKLLALGLYPAGTVVELADGTTAVVLAPHDPRAALHTAAKPLVALLTDGDGHAYPNPKFLDLASVGGGSVVRTLAPMDRLKRLGRSYPEWA